jgi:hypothetical protein
VVDRPRRPALLRLDGPRADQVVEIVGERHDRGDQHLVVGPPHVLDGAVGPDEPDRRVRCAEVDRHHRVLAGGRDDVLGDRRA